MSIDQSLLNALSNILGNENRAKEIIQTQIKRLVLDGAKNLTIVTQCERLAIERKGNAKQRQQRWAKSYRKYRTNLMLLSEIIGSRDKARLLILQQKN